MAFLLDTNSCIDFARGRSIALLWRMDRVPAGSLSMSAITLAELSVGARADRDDQAKLDALTQIVTVHPFDAAAAEVYGMRARMLGVRRKSFDRLIGAHALALDLTLVTANERDFADLPGLRIENWTLPL
ncbi:type II toxin-antitoxin system VapC family toxin [Sphingomonas qomolangmaensis]|uniref:Ribonuclease VapC n=1 Tax=Sphingomonas qomolangmaensis TaxID=2918765 RepID=A0ABY5LCP9_9SPHN|nr:type II toxin-antitoxin system VapC family toxin [Sphingomonas qomolangmaensis]UUL83627.1 type II toxin-antitoxin system VapC family toxin [Sphingomonas qomolangmaensis]